MKVLIIKSDDCVRCTNYIKRLKAENFAFETMDGDANENQDYLDRWKVTEYPVVQIIDDVGTVLWSFPTGTWKTGAIRAKMKSLLKGKP